MKTFLNYFKDYFKEDFNLISHLLIGLFIFTCIYLNYSYEVYSEYFRVVNYEEVGVLKLWGMYAFAFLVPIGIISFFNRNQKKIFNLSYLLLGLLGLLFVTIDSSYYLLKYVRDFIPKESLSYNFIYSCVANTISLFSIITPCFITYSMVKKFHPELYGLRLNGANIKPYLWLIAIMIPIVGIASMGEDFLSYYPSYDTRGFSSSQLSENIKIWLYELCYGFDFLSVELIFRGFMVVALSKFVGKHAILPMVACYAFLHFGKPMMETVGSVFGGFALGVLAYKSRNIYGGLIVHLGVAWGMELAAFMLK